MHIDFGTGDGAFVARAARAEPSVLFIGVDAAAEPLRDRSRKAGPNALFGLMPLAEAPGDLAGRASTLTVLLPWGSLLTCVARAEAEGLSKLRGLCADGASVRFVFGYGSGDGVGLPAIELRGLEAGYRAAGFDVRARTIAKEEVRALGTTWAGKLGFSGVARTFVELTGRRTSTATDRPDV